MKIIRVDGDKNRTVVARNLSGIAHVAKVLIPLLNEKKARTPNDPHIDICGLNEVGIFIGVYRVESYLIEND